MTLRVSAAVAVVVIAIVAAAAIIALNSRPTSYVPAGSGNLRTSSPAATPSPVTAHAMDAPVTLPNNFPKDFPVYPAARSTFVGYDYSFGSLNWTINWETTDSADQAYAWYRVHLDQGDWKITSATAGSIEFTRKSNPNCVGDVTFTQRYPGVTQIDVTVCG